MTDEHPPKEEYDAHHLRKLVNKSIERMDHQPDQETAGLILPTTEMAQTLRPLFREDVILLAPYQEGEFIDVRNDEVLAASDINPGRFADLRLANLWPVDGGMK